MNEDLDYIWYIGLFLALVGIVFVIFKHDNFIFNVLMWTGVLLAMSTLIRVTFRYNKQKKQWRKQNKQN